MRGVRSTRMNSRNANGFSDNERRPGFGSAVRLDAALALAQARDQVRGSVPCSLAVHRFRFAVSSAEGGEAIAGAAV